MKHTPFLDMALTTVLLLDNVAVLMMRSNYVPSSSPCLPPCRARRDLIVAGYLTSTFCSAELVVGSAGDVSQSPRTARLPYSPAGRRRRLSFLQWNHSSRISRHSYYSVSFLIGFISHISAPTIGPTKISHRDIQLYRCKNFYVFYFLNK